MGVKESVRDAQLAVQEALQAGEHFLTSLGMTDVDVDGADLAIEMPVTGRLANSGGGLQGGLIATLIDVVAGRLSISGVDAGHRTATNDMNVHFLAPIVDGPARAEGKVLRRGRQSVVVHVDVRDLATDRLAATSTLSFTVLAPLSDG
jgi:uncharacterized protein (TIGR00369 family)